MSFDRRNCMAKLPAIIKNLRELDYKDEDEIPYKDIQYFINLERGLDSRTERKYFKLLTRLGYLIPTTKRKVETKKFLRIKTKQNVSTREYTIEAGYQTYKFGPRAPKLYDETLNPKYVPPKTPLPKRVSECQSQNNMCVLSTPSECVSGDGRGGVHDVVVEIEKRERDALHTHILNSVIAKGESNGCPYLKVGNGVHCEAVFWNGLKSTYRPVAPAEIPLCKTRFAECPDYQSKLGVR